MLLTEHMLKCNPSAKRQARSLSRRTRIPELPRQVPYTSPISPLSGRGTLPQHPLPQARADTLAGAALLHIHGGLRLHAARLPVVHFSSSADRRQGQTRPPLATARPAPRPSPPALLVRSSWFSRSTWGGEVSWGLGQESGIRMEKMRPNWISGRGNRRPTGIGFSVVNPVCGSLWALAARDW